MPNRTLVKVSAGESCIGFKTVSRRRRSGREFLVTRDELARLENELEVMTCDIHSFAVLRRDVPNGTLIINFSWLQGGCDSQLTGWEEMVILPFDALMAFVETSKREDGPKKWRVLSLQPKVTPQIVFADTEGLHRCLENRTVRKKLARALRDNFRYADRVVLYHDFVAYSFLFQSFRTGRPQITGGLILHDQEHMEKAYYSVHT